MANSLCCVCLPIFCTGVIHDIANNSDSSAIFNSNASSFADLASILIIMGDVAVTVGGLTAEDMTAGQ